MVRLKGGDAFIFGRGGEELEYLREHGVRYEVVPGITAALACAAYAGIPLTHREHAQSVRLVTAHCRDDEDNLDWPALAREKQTLAFYMGVGQLDALSRRLISHGRAGHAVRADRERQPPGTARAVGRSEGPARSGAGARHPLARPAHRGRGGGLASRLQWFGRHIDGGQGDGQPQRLAA